MKFVTFAMLCSDATINDKGTSERSDNGMLL